MKPVPCTITGDIQTEKPYDRDSIRVSLTLEVPGYMDKTMFTRLQEVLQYAVNHRCIGLSIPEPDKPSNEPVINEELVKTADPLVGSW